VRQEIQERIFLVKREVVRLRRFSSPMRQGLDLLQEQPGLVGDALLPYFRDVTEHAIRVSELADNIRRAVREVMALDPTRPALIDGGDALTDKSLPVYGNHYNEGNFRQYPDEAYSMDWAFSRNKLSAREGSNASITGSN
jgi:hypothetical protein